MIKDCKRFLNKIKDLKLYLIKFNEDGTMKDKTYSPNCAVGDEDYWSVIIIPYDEYIFFVNDGIYKTWTRVENVFLQ